MMSLAMPAISRPAATKIAISSPLERPPPLVELAAGTGTVTGPVLDAGVVAVGPVVGRRVVAGLVAPTARAPAGDSQATVDARSRTSKTCRVREIRQRASGCGTIAAI
jgi:hypothetical protein